MEHKVDCCAIKLAACPCVVSRAPLLLVSIVGLEQKPSSQVRQLILFGLQADMVSESDERMPSMLAVQ